jgi:hypothetical protein
MFTTFTRGDTVSRRTRIALDTLNLLAQEVKNADGRRLNTYVRLKAAEETSEEARDNEFSMYGGGSLLHEEEYKRLKPDIQKKVLARVKGNGHPIAKLSAELYRIVPSHVVLWWRTREQDLITGIYCSGLDEALSVLLLSRVSMPEGTAMCTRCWKVFSRSRIKQKFCSRRCGNAVRQTRRRAKQKKTVPDTPPLRP